MFSKFKDENFSPHEVYETLSVSSRPRADFYVLMFLAAIIATFGLLLNNPAIIIGAMLISPVMDPILGLAFSSLTKNGPFWLRASGSLISGIVLAILVSLLITLMFSSLGVTQEILARTKPSLLDLLVALATGFVAGYVKVRRELVGTIYGVAISISLMPPLCVIGIGLAFGKSEIYTGASLLFLTNFFSILFSGLLSFLLLDFGYFKKTLKSLILPTISIVLLAIPLTFTFYAIQQKKFLENELKDILQRQTSTFRNRDIVSIETDTFKKPVAMEVTVRANTDSINANQVQLVQAYLEEKAKTPVHLTVNLLPIIQLEGGSVVNDE